AAARLAEEAIGRARGRQVQTADHAEPDVGCAAGLEEPGLEVEADVADALTVEPELVLSDIRTAIAAHDQERHRGADLELGGPGVDAECADQRRADDVVDRVGVALAVEL